MASWACTCLVCRVLRKHDEKLTAEDSRSPYARRVKELLINTEKYEQYVAELQELNDELKNYCSQDPSGEPPADKSEAPNYNEDAEELLTETLRIFKEMEREWRAKRDVLRAQVKTLVDQRRNMKKEYKAKLAKKAAELADLDKSNAGRGGTVGDQTDNLSSASTMAESGDQQSTLQILNSDFQGFDGKNMGLSMVKWPDNETPNKMGISLMLDELNNNWQTMMAQMQYVAGKENEITQLRARVAHLEAINANR